MKILRKTASICPKCYEKIEAHLVTDGKNVFIEKNCAQHGFFSAVTWRGEPSLEAWLGQPPEEDLSQLNCLNNCGLCAQHKQKTCCYLLEVTSRCNLKCSHCFAESSSESKIKDPGLQEIKAQISEIAKTDQAFLQLSGGEPTLRGDLAKIIKHAKKEGCQYVQLNTNGLRLAEDEKYVKQLAEAGLSFVFLQFDGCHNNIYKNLRGQALLETKLKAIKMCGLYNIGVTLVPTIVPGINDDDLGNIIRLAVKNSPVVRGVHFQPVSYFGRFPKEVNNNLRITLPEVLNKIYKQAPELIKENSLAASGCDHPRCGFHGAYIVQPNGNLKAYTKAKLYPKNINKTSAENNRHFVGLRWQRPQEEKKPNKLNIPMFLTEKPKKVETETSDNINSLDNFLIRAKSHSFTISAMAFQDAYTLDLERLQNCSLHVYKNGQVIPFCAYYILEKNI